MSSEKGGHSIAAYYQSTAAGMCSEWKTLISGSTGLSDHVICW